MMNQKEKQVSEWVVSSGLTKEVLIFSSPY